MHWCQVAVQFSVLTGQGLDRFCCCMCRLCWSWSSWESWEQPSAYWSKLIPWSCLSTLNLSVTHTWRTFSLSHASTHKR